MRTMTIKAATSGIRLDVLLAISIPDLSRSAAQRLLSGGFVTLPDGTSVQKSRLVNEGEVFIVDLQDPETPSAEPQDIPLEVVYEDADVIVVNKPRGMVVHPAPGHADGTLVNALLYHCGDSLSGIGGELRPGIVHRIDKDTSGLIIAAKNDFAHASLSSQLSSRSLSRIYEAVVCGSLRDDSGVIDAPIGRHPTDRKRQAVTDRNSRPARTHYEVIGRYNGYTHVRCMLETGRTHQIRVHMAYIGHPLLGDLVYGRKKPEKGLSGQCLHAKTLKFIHPRSGEPILLDTDLPEYFTEVLRRLGNEF
ncbi:MAG: RluA family pseudouridine synthase [Clostridiales bacterium]|nr:RluA family pseudouridine synthase [Clostridiales bacterium]